MGEARKYRKKPVVIEAFEPPDWTDVPKAGALLEGIGHG